MHTFCSFPQRAETFFFWKIKVKLDKIFFFIECRNISSMIFSLETIDNSAAAKKYDKKLFLITIIKNQYYNFENIFKCILCESVVISFIILLSLLFQQKT